MALPLGCTTPLYGWIKMMLPSGWKKGSGLNRFCPTSFNISFFSIKPNPGCPIPWADYYPESRGGLLKEQQNTKLKAGVRIVQIFPTKPMCFKIKWVQWIPTMMVFQRCSIGLIGLAIQRLQKHWHIEMILKPFHLKRDLKKQPVSP